MSVLFVLQMVEPVVLDLFLFALTLSFESAILAVEPTLVEKDDIMHLVLLQNLFFEHALH